MPKLNVFFYVDRSREYGQHSRLGIHVASSALGARRITEKRSMPVRYLDLHVATLDVGRNKKGVVYKSEPQWAIEVKAALQEGFDSITYTINDCDIEFMCIFSSGRLTKVSPVFGGRSEDATPDESIRAA